MALAAEITESMAFSPLCLYSECLRPSLPLPPSGMCVARMVPSHRWTCFAKDACFGRRSGTWTGKNKLPLPAKVLANRLALPRSTHLFVSAEHGTVVDHVWKQLRREAAEQSEAEPYLASFYYASVLAHASLERSLSFHLANKLANATLLSTQLFSLFWETFAADKGIQDAIRADINAFKERDPACTSYVHGMLNFKGFLACEAYRVSHRLWCQGRLALALALQNRISEVFHVDIHPGAKIGKGVLFDHATGVVVGETAVIGDNVSILHHVTLGGTGNCCEDRHPKIGNGVLIGAAAILLGAINVGDGAKIGACSLVLNDVPSYTTALGVPAKILSDKRTPVKEEMPALSMDHTSMILDYVI